MADKTQTEERETGYREVTPLAVGNKYWWRRRNMRGAFTMEVLQLSEAGVKFKATYDFYGLGNPEEVTWSMEEWNAALKDSTIHDYLPPVKQEDLKPDEELCHMCHGSRWERMRDSDIEPCIWCSFTGKRKKSPPVEPTHHERSPMHPPVPIKKT